MYVRRCSGSRPGCYLCLTHLETVWTMVEHVGICGGYAPIRGSGILLYDLPDGKRGNVHSPRTARPRAACGISTGGYSAPRLRRADRSARRIAEGCGEVAGDSG